MTKSLMCLSWLKSETYILVIASSKNFSGLWGGTAKYFLNNISSW